VVAITIVNAIQIRRFLFMETLITKMH